jgi:hypothetical protein
VETLFEILFEILSALVSLLLEALLELAAEAVLDLLLRGAAHALTGLFKAAEDRNPVFAALGFALLGVLAGALSIHVFPHPLVHRQHPSKFHGISLVLSPIATGLAMSLLGSILRRRGKKVVPIESFWFGFAFALGMALVRFFFAK